MRLIKCLQEMTDFSEAEKSIAQYMLDNPKKMIDLSIRDLAEQTYTSTATVYRLCQKIGLTGYTEFKIKFITEVNRSSSFDHPITSRPIKDDDDATTIAMKISSLEIESIEETRNEMTVAQLNRTAGYLDRARIIDIYAFDVNRQIAEITAYDFQQIQKTVITRPAVESQYLQAMNAGSGHVAILLSRTGENRHLINIARILRKKKIRMLLFSTRKQSTLAEICDEFLYVANVEESLDMGGLIYGIGVRYYLDVFFSIILSRHYEQVTQRFGEFETIFGKLNDKNKLW